MTPDTPPPKVARLPVSHLERTLGEMAGDDYPGSWCAYIEPQAMVVDEDLGCWLNPATVLSGQTFVSAGSLFIRCGHGGGGFTVDIVEATHRWRPGPVPEGFLPVTELVTHHAAVQRPDPSR